jgi:hypothetical protein
MIEWFKRHVEKITTPWGSVTLRKPNVDPVFNGFTRWSEVKGEVAGPSRVQVELTKLEGISREEWDLLTRLRFWRLSHGEKTSTFGFKADELPEVFLGPLRHWIGLALRIGGDGERTQGGIFCVNVANETISVIGD